MASTTEWIAGARPRTLPAAATPVLVGSGAAAQVGGFALGPALLALGVALALQVGVNYANDYSDGVRGTDLDRVGPMRLTATGAARPGQVRAAAFGAFGVAAVLGLVLCAVTGHWWLIAVGALAILAAWYYTGGRNPYGYRGLGEVGVFVFFGLVATLGTTYTQSGVVTWPSAVGAVAVGLLACAILMVNNVRDIPTDVVAGKRTLAVRLGDFRARRAYVAMIWLPLLLAVVCAFASPWALATLLLLLPAALLSVPVIAGARGPLLVPVLAGTGLYELAYGVLLGVGLAL
ncbi:1,4-dihydroxy-2-naphthoate polyprenyltransferase [Cellulosimicrobium composti]|uniref:1,4-dihydroxy-2-naphthoate octaprenyltransferase n=1 Tax=Cellulosimicrobium composti TaxID=2672572 RepID=A0ABX0BFZ6_9MICO|nr:1,4-dihydroxy-2-naphthoate polyprenyltransferase [Cellulosimicrobium composti]NDO89946.1 1,4-dihydroxy-2-naphthoate polyprenyltransferase [Cellulosimicrobium composti]TWG85004.1 1,4-dihydroxy-2-naphthoate prenyltransferase [Cellulosimicrobium cellulans J34]SME93311.1 1,4-dihydroxy-2-naphthoate prenyltransferase [Cellulosimicrobium cellulans J1]